MSRATQQKKKKLGLGLLFKGLFELKNFTTRTFGLDLKLSRPDSNQPTNTYNWDGLKMSQSNPTRPMNTSSDYIETNSD